MGIKVREVLVVGISIVQEGTDGFAASVSDIEDFLLVNGMGDGLTYTDILQYGIAAIYGHHKNERTQRFLQLHIWAGLENRNIISIDHIANVDLTGDQTLDLYRPFRNNVHDDLIQFGIPFHPIVLVLF